MLQRLRAVSNTVPNLIGPRFKPHTSRSSDERVTAQQLAGANTGYLCNIQLYCKRKHVFFLLSRRAS